MRPSLLGMLDLSRITIERDTNFDIFSKTDLLSSISRLWLKLLNPIQNLLSPYLIYRLI